MIRKQCPYSCETIASANVVISEPRAINAVTRAFRATNEKGAVPVGVRSASFLNDGTFEGKVNGVTIMPGTSIMFPVLGGNTVYGEITYDATNTSIRIDCTMWGDGAPYMWPHG
jgi:hypothetical protein